MFKKKKKKQRNDRSDYEIYKHFLEINTPLLEELNKRRDYIMDQINDGDKSFKKYEKLKEIGKEIIMLESKMDYYFSTYSEGYERYKKQESDKNE